MIQYTRKLKQELQKISMEAGTKAFADLVAMGWDEMDVFIVLGHYRSTYSDQFNKQQLDKVMQDPSMVNYINKKTRAIKRNASVDAMEEIDRLKEEVEATNEDAKMLSKEDVLNELISSLRLLKKNDPRRVDILMKYADLQQMKKEDVKEEDTLVHYYLPVQCFSCDLYNAARLRREREKATKQEETNKEEEEKEE